MKGDFVQVPPLPCAESLSSVADCQKVGTAVPLKALNTRARAQKLVQKDVSCTFCSSTQGWDLSQEWGLNQALPPTSYRI